MKCERCASEDLVASRRPEGALHPQDSGGWMGRVALMGLSALVIFPLILIFGLMALMSWGMLGAMAVVSVGVVALLLVIIGIDGWQGAGRVCRIRCRDCGHETRIPWL